jgi:CRISPR-associated protein Cas5d
MNPSVSVRVWSDFACFTRPEMKVERVSYPIPTPSAARGILEAIFWEPQMYYLIDRVDVVRRGNWFSFRRNEVKKVISELDARGWILGTKDFEPIEAGGGAADAAQRNMLALADVEYVITAEIRLSAQAKPPGDNIWKYVEQVRSRTLKGKCAHRPAMGCREFAADFDLVEDPSRVAKATSFNEDLGIMLYDVFDPLRRAAEKNVRPQPVFFRAKVAEGTMDCHPERIESRFIRPASGRM